MGARWAVIAVLLATAAPVRADILVWRDADGVRHFTNRPDSVPADLPAEVLVRDTGRPPAADVAPPPASAAAALPPAAAAADIARLDEAYRAGLAAGLDAVLPAGGGAHSGGGGGGSATGGTVQIVGPLAVADAHVFDPGWSAYGWPGYYPFVTTGFDGGRSRHQTLRMLLQDQFQIDRDGPYAYDRWTQPGLGPALEPFLPRGLPVSVRQYGRVLYR